ncbi:MAG: chemotaxis protein CheC [Methanosarcinaceae archaeon]|nr:chemotaxis protein CheC [Methanosarcinaceae archaeon]MDD4496566.1 chemotaxis protein CheC [Methanosarcinaceae archaeon]
MTKQIRELSELQYGALKEIGNIGIGNAATSLSKLVNTRVRINIPNTKLELIENIPKFTETSDSPVMGTFMRISKNLEGYILVIFSENSAKSICQILTRENEIELSNSINISLMEEAGHILAGTYVTALSDFLHMEISISTPYTAYDMSEAILNYVLTEMSYNVDFALLFDTELLVEDKKIKGTFLTLLEPESLENLLIKIKEMMGF